MINEEKQKTIMADIRRIANEVVAGYHTKKSALPLISQLSGLRCRLPDIPHIRQHFDHLVCMAKEASGHGRQKQHWLSILEKDIILLEMDLKGLPEFLTAIQQNERSAS